MSSYLYESFDLTNGFNILRIVCGLFLVPHLYAKASNLEFAYGMYREWRLHPPKAWVHACIVIEVIGSIGLVFAIYTRYVAALVAIFLFVAAWATWRHSGGKWLWPIGGMEYPLFWAFCCVALALLA